MSYSWLPQVYREIAEAAGLEAARGLARVKAGQRFRAPKNPKSAPWLTAAMGEDGAAAFCAIFCGDIVELPTNPFEGVGQKARARRIARAIDEERSANQIAAAEGVGRWTVFYHRRKRKLRAQQPDLFSEV